VTHTLAGDHEWLDGGAITSYLRICKRIGSRPGRGTVGATWDKRKVEVSGRMYPKEKNRCLRASRHLQKNATARGC